MRRLRRGYGKWLGVGCMLAGAACGDDGGLLNGGGGPGGGDPSDATGASGGGSTTEAPDLGHLRGNSIRALLKATDCDDLLSKIQDDAITKLDLTVSLYKGRSQEDWGGASGGGGNNSVGFGSGGVTGWGTTGLGGLLPPTAANGGDVSGGTGFADGGGVTGGAAGSGATGNGGIDVGAGAGSEGDSGGRSDSPIGSSNTNTQVEGVDEADFVKVVKQGEQMFLLHGNRLLKLKTFPPEQTALAGEALEVEGVPTEMFVTDAGKAVVFSTVHGYGHPPAGYDYNYCGPFWCGGAYGGFTKMTVADVSGDTPVTLRELYYQGSYLSSRRYDDVVRVVMQSQTPYSGLYAPRVEWADAWGRPYAQEQIDAQLDQWRERQAASIQNTTLADWLPLVQEARDDELVDVEPACDAYFVPESGVTEYGLTHVLALDLAQPDADVGGVTVVGASATVYSNAARMVLAQPDYRWQDSMDFGFIDEQRTSLHVFSLSASDTDYLASGWVPGHLPPANAQFGLDVAADGTVRAVTTGFKRKDPDADEDEPQFWEREPQNLVVTSRVKDGVLEELGRSDNLGHIDRGETVQSARFVGDRAYVVTFRQTDPLIVLDVEDPAQLRVLGEIEIPGFSQYMHPLDETHLITFGQSGDGGTQLQLFDVTDPANIPQPKVLAFGRGSWSELSNNHKAFTFYAEQNLIALPVHGYYYDAEQGRQGYEAGLQVIEVDAEQGFTRRGTADHSPLYALQSCGGVCDEWGCYDYYCRYQPEVRRGHFVQGEEGTYVYSFSHAGVMVNDVAEMAEALTSVELPAPQGGDGVPWYAGEGSDLGGGSANTTGADFGSGSADTTGPATGTSGG